MLDSSSENGLLFEIFSVGIIGVFLFGVIMLIKWCSGNNKNPQNTSHMYNYGDIEGPFTWTKKFHMPSENQSPICLLSTIAEMNSSENLPHLEFSLEYDQEPQQMQMINDSHSVVIYATWCNGARPRLSGGPLTGEYKFFNLRFRWGANDDEGSEHMIDMKKYALELQATFVKNTCKCPDIVGATKSGCVLIISYLFQITPIDNYYLEMVISGLQHVKFPCQKYYIKPVPLSFLAPIFERQYFFYIGSLTFPPCTEGVRWIVLFEPLSISSKQVSKFRKLCSHTGTISTNVRPLQNCNDRCVNFYS